MPKTSSAMNPAVDAYIAKAAPFAQPVLTYVRDLVHRAVPGVVEEMKWSRPFFVYKGIILGNVSAFKTHCSVGFWGEDITSKLRVDGALIGEGMGSLGRLESVEQLPPAKKLMEYWKLGAQTIDSGERTVSFKRPQRVAKKAVSVPEELTMALEKNVKAKSTFDGFPPSCQREYSVWIADAKRPETREKRVKQAIEQMAEGKRHNWKYESR